MHGMLLNFLASHILVNDHDFVLFSLCTGLFILKNLGTVWKTDGLLVLNFSCTLPINSVKRVRHATAANKIKDKCIMLLVLPWASEKLCGLESNYFWDRLLSWLDIYNVAWRNASSGQTEMQPDKLWGNHRMIYVVEDSNNISFRCNPCLWTLWKTCYVNLNSKDFCFARRTWVGVWGGGSFWRAIWLETDIAPSSGFPSRSRVSRARRLHTCSPDRGI
jgi:hypothetical protein